MLTVINIAISAILYSILMYITFISVAILYRGLKFKLLLPSVKVFSFIIICYISIITDVMLVAYDLSIHLLVKNSTILILVVLSFYPILKIGKGGKSV